MTTAPQEAMQSGTDIAADMEKWVSNSGNLVAAAMVYWHKTHHIGHVLS
jgi:hypothetical protein